MMYPAYHAVIGSASFPDASPSVTTVFGDIPLARRTWVVNPI
jgi:hypothetical protein